MSDTEKKPLIAQTATEQQSTVSDIMGTKKPKIEPQSLTVEPPQKPRVRMGTVEITASKPKTTDEARTDAVEKALKGKDEK
jgi:hypothetical protein